MDVDRTIWDSFRVNRDFSYSRQNQRNTLLRFNSEKVAELHQNSCYYPAQFETEVDLHFFIGILKKLIFYLLCVDEHTYVRVCMCEHVCVCMYM